MDNHLVEDPPTNDVRQQWMQDDVYLFLSWADSIELWYISMAMRIIYFGGKHCRRYTSSMETN